MYNDYNNNHHYGELENIKILLIEDNPGDAKLVEIYLRESQSFEFELTHVTRLNEGIKCIQEDNFDIVLLDLSLPDSSRMETLSKALANFPRSVSIVVLTGLDDNMLGVRAIEEGAQDFLVKGSIDSISLTRAILHSIKRRELLLQVEGVAQSLKVSEERLLQAQRIAKMGNYEWIVGSEDMYWSKELFAILGFDEENGKGTFTNYLEKIPDNEKANVREQLNNAAQNSEPFNFEHCIILDKSNGQLKYLRNQGQIEKDSLKGQIKIVGTIQDISIFKRAEQELRLSEERYRTIFQGSQDVIYLSTKEGLITDYNPSFIHLFGYSKENEKHEDIYLSDLYEATNSFADYMKTMEEKGSVKDFEAKLKKKNGEVMDCLITSTIWEMGDGMVKGYHGIIRDITTLKKTQQLIRAKEVAERSARLKEQFLANMSHEIRTPMNVVIGMTHLLENTELTNKQTEYLSALKLSSQTLMKLINNVLDFSKIESGKLKLEQTPFNILELLNEIVHTYKFKAKEKRINLFKQIDAFIPDIVVGDVVKLQMILNNLVSNAIKYTEKGEILLRVDLIDEKEEYINIGFSVKDTGIGIPQNKLNTVFEVFEQASEETTRLFGGTGLGLAIAKRLVGLFGGEITVKSEVGSGSVFRFNIPFQKYDKNSKENVVKYKINTLEIPDDAEAILQSEDDISVFIPEEVTNADASNWNEEKYGNVRILLVEDHTLNQLVATDLLKKWSPNLELEIADNGQIAIDILENKTFDIILMDISMPVMDGYETTKHIRNNMREEVKSLPIIAMTAHAFNKNAQMCFDAGMNEFVSKPISPSVMYSKLNKLLLPINKEAQQHTNQVHTENEFAISNSNNDDDMPFSHEEKRQDEYQNKKIVVEEQENEPAGVHQDSLPELNFAYLDSLTQGNQEFRMQMLETILRDMPGEVEKVKADFESQNLEQLKKSAHKLKSTCSYLGADEAQLLAKTVENNAFEKKDLDKMPTLVADLYQKANYAVTALKLEVEKLTQLM